MVPEFLSQESSSLAAVEPCLAESAPAHSQYRDEGAALGLHRFLAKLEAQTTVDISDSAG